MSSQMVSKIFLEVLRETNVPNQSLQLLAQEEWEYTTQLVDFARYNAVSGGRLPDEPQQISAQVEPVPSENDPVYVSGFRVELNHAPSGTSTSTFIPNSVAEYRGREIAAALMMKGDLQSEDHYRVRLSFGPPTAIEANRLAETELEVSPFPVTRRRLEDWGVTSETVAHADSERPVFVRQSVLDSAVAQAESAFNFETGALLLGSLVEDRRAYPDRWAVVVTEQCKVDHGVGTMTTFTFPPESFRKTRQLAELRKGGEHVVGSQHSHGWRCAECDKQCEIRNLFFSSDDVRMTQQFPVYGVYLVVGGDPERDRDRPVVEVYARKGGVITSVPYGVFA